MSFDLRQAERRRIIDRIMLASQVLAVVYLATHALIVWQGYETDGWLAALLTLLLLGFGDLYWGVRWAYEGDRPAMAAVALAAATVCFVSWTTRAAFNRWVHRFTADMLRDFGDELTQITREAEEHEAQRKELARSGNDAENPSPNESEPRGGAGGSHA